MKKNMTLAEAVEAQKDKSAQKLKLLLDEMGVDNPEDVISATDDDVKKFAQSVNKALGVGKKAARTLQQMQSRDIGKELASMGFDNSTLKKKYASVDEFGLTVPSFVIARSTIKQTLRSYDGTSIEIDENQDICMTAGMYQEAVNSVHMIVPSNRKFSDIYKPYRGENLDGKTLFVWRTGGIGDLMFIRPVLMAFKKKYDVRIIFGTKERYHSMVEQWDDCIDTLTTVPFIPSETLDEASYHISYEGLIERCDEAEELDVHDLFAKHSHVELEEYNYRMKCICKNKVFDLLPKEYAVMQIGASSAIRTPLMGSLVPVANYLAKHTMVVISGSARESRNIEDFISCCDEPDRFINFANYTGSVVDAVKLVDGSSLVIAPDSSHVHMAGAQGVPCVGLYGPFPWKSRALHYKNFIGVEPEESNVCASDGKHCFLHSFLPCEYGVKCWRNLKSKDIIHAINVLTGWK